MDERSVDAEIVARVQGGDKSAFNLLVIKYQHKVTKLVARFIRDNAEVQDVTQEAFIKAYRALANFRGDSAFYTWLYRIAINTAKNYLVSQGRRPPNSDIDAEIAEGLDSAPGMREIATPERIMLRDEIAQTVHRVVAGLPEDLRTAITLREIDGMSYEDIAQVMDCPIGTVRSRIFRAREAIDNELRPLVENE
ncbi:MAG: RNA polymerase sigma factor RpoE [Acidiferrobacterales bacterium]|nr:RNA polymerase sigma factor RpoE [Acidiferrobacterales bacterium]